MKTAIAAATSLAITAGTAFAGETITSDDVPRDAFGTGGICMISINDGDISVQNTVHLSKCLDYARLLSDSAYGIKPIVKGVIDAESYDEPFGFRCVDQECISIDLE